MVSGKSWVSEKGPLPVLLSVPETLIVKLPDWVGVPDTVTLSAVPALTPTPAGRPLTPAVYGALPPLKVKVWL